MAKKMLPTSDNIKKVQDRWNRAKARADKLVKKKIAPIYFELAGRYAAWLKDSKYAPWIMDKVTNSNVDMAKLLLALPDPHRDPSWGREHLEVTEQFAKELGLDRKTADNYLKELFEKAMVNPTRNGYQRIRGANLHTMAQHPKYLDPDLIDLVLAFTRFELQELRDEVIEYQLEVNGTPPSPMGAIRPRWKAIKDVPGVLPIEDMREVLKTKEKWAVVRCVCMNDDRETDCPAPLERCMVTDRSAEFRLSKRDARELTLKEAFDLYDDYGKYLLLNMPGRLPKDVKEAGPGCVCHWDCCLAMTHYYLPGSKYKIADFIMKNRFRATVDPEKCIGCRRCVEERCQFGAAQMKYYPEFGAERAYIDEEKCMGCGLCVETCTVGCRGMKIVEPPEYILEAKESPSVMAMAIDVESLRAAREAKKKK